MFSFKFKNKTMLEEINRQESETHSELLRTEALLEEMQAKKSMLQRRVVRLCKVKQTYESTNVVQINKIKMKEK